MRPSRPAGRFGHVVAEFIEKLEGNGEVFLHSGGTIVPMQLAAEERLKVDTGCLVALTPGVNFEIQYVGKVKTALFGGEGLFFATLRGPFSRLADRIHAAYKGDREDVKRDLGGAIGKIGNLIGGK